MDSFQPEQTFCLKWHLAWFCFETDVKAEALAKEEIILSISQGRDKTGQRKKMQTSLISPIACSLVLPASQLSFRHLPRLSSATVMKFLLLGHMGKTFCWQDIPGFYCFLYLDGIEFLLFSTVSFFIIRLSILCKRIATFALQHVVTSTSCKQ